MDTLATKGTRKAVKEALKSLPNDLNRTYNEAMQRIESQNDDDRQLAERVLYWISYALRPLTVEELNTHSQSNRENQNLMKTIFLTKNF